MYTCIFHSPTIDVIVMAITITSTIIIVIAVVRHQSQLNMLICIYLYIYMIIYVYSSPHQKKNVVCLLHVILCAGTISVFCAGSQHAVSVYFMRRRSNHNKNKNPMLLLRI